MGGFEPPLKVLQTCTLPLGHMTLFTISLSFFLSQIQVVEIKTPLRYVRFYIYFLKPVAEIHSYNRVGNYLPGFCTIYEEWVAEILFE
jgi:hypothetical protein